MVCLVMPPDDRFIDLKIKSMACSGRVYYQNAASDLFLNLHVNINERRKDWKTQFQTEFTVNLKILYKRLYGESEYDN